MKPRRYRVASRLDSNSVIYSDEYTTAAQADREADYIAGLTWTEVFDEVHKGWIVLSYQLAQFQDSGRDVLIDIDGTGRWELFSSCSNQHDARNMAKHYQENR
jgi:hypothetical protein